MVVISLRKWHRPIETMQSTDPLFHHGVARRRPGRNFPPFTRLIFSWISPDSETVPSIGLPRSRPTRVTGPNRRPRALRPLIGVLTLGLARVSGAPDSLTITGSTAANPVFLVNTDSGLCVASSPALTGTGGSGGVGVLWNGKEHSDALQPDAQVPS